MGRPPPVQAAVHLWDDQGPTQHGGDGKGVAQACQLEVDQGKVALRRAKRDMRLGLTKLSRRTVGSSTAPLARG